MLKTFWAIVRQEKIEPLESTELLEGTKVLITMLPNDADFYLQAAQVSLDKAWNNAENDVYPQLL